MMNLAFGISQVPVLGFTRPSAIFVILHSLAAGIDPLLVRLFIFRSENKVPGEISICEMCRV